MSSNGYIADPEGVEAAPEVRSPGHDLEIGGNADAESQAAGLAPTGPAPTGPAPAMPAGPIGALKRLVPHGIRQRLIPPLGHLRAQYGPRPLSAPRSYFRQSAPEPAPTISIVVPSLNTGLYLSATLDSILDQRYPALDLIVRDGGSDDNTPHILHRERERLAEVNAGPDEGQAEAINEGLNDAGGEILAWINADDMLLPGALARVSRYFVANPDVDVVYGNRVLLDEQGQDVGLWVTPPHSPDSLQWFDFIPQETVFWRRSIWERVGGIDSSYTYGFDWDLFLRFHAAEARIVRLPRFLGAFRQHEGQKTRRCYEDAQAELEAIRHRFHGRAVSIEEAQARSEKVLIRAAPHHIYQRLAWHSGRSVPVEAGPYSEADARGAEPRSTATGSPASGAATGAAAAAGGGNGHGGNGAAADSD